MKNSIRLGRLFGIEIGFDFSWILIFALVTWALAQNYMTVLQNESAAVRWALAFVTSLLFFSSVLAHELAHSLVSKAEGIPVSRITLFFFGGASQIEQEPRRARDEFWMAFVGPLTSLLLAVLFGVLWFLTQNTIPAIAEMSAWLAGMNAILGLFNLLPGFPLDGGRILRSIVWGVTKSLRRATQVAVGSGIVLSWLLITLGLWEVLDGDWADGLWIAFIGWLLQSAAVQESRVTVVHDLLRGHTVREVPVSNCPHVLKQLSLDVFAENVALPGGPRCFAVIDGDHFLGLLTTHRLNEVPRNKWETTRVGEVMIPPEKLVVTQPGEELPAVLDKMAEADVNQLPVVENGKLLGVVTRASILEFLRLLSAKQKQ